MPALSGTPQTQIPNPTRDARHETRWRRLRCRYCPRRAPRQATGPPLRPQGSLSRSLRDGPTARP
jgi:hypothetical protein